MRRFTVRFAIGLATAAAVAPSSAWAQGYGVYEQGTCTMGRAGTAVAAPCADGSAIFFNPAAVVTGDGPKTLLSVGGTGVAARGSFTNDLTGRESPLEKSVIPVPHAYFTHQLSPRLAAGIGLFAPYGLTIDWNPDQAEGRFLGYHSRVAAVYVQPTVAAKITDALSIGAGLDVNFARVGLKQRIDLSSQALPIGGTFANLGVPAGTDFAAAEVKARGTAFGYHVGVQFKPAEELSVGARYMSRQLVEFNDGEATFTQIPTGRTVPVNIPNPATGATVVPAGTPIDNLVASQFSGNGLLTTQGGSTYLRMPEQLVVGVSFMPLEKLRVLADFQYTNWTVFDQLVLNFEKLGTRVQREDYKKAYTYRLGGEYALTETSQLRAGFYTHGAAAPDQTVTPLLPEGPRTSWTLGYGTRLGQKVRVDLAYQYIDQADRRGRTVPTETVEANNGLYNFRAHLFGATFAYAF